MGKLIDALKAGAKAAASGMGPGEYAIGGIQIRCNHCGGARFDLRDGASTSVGSFAAFAGYAVVCAACTHVMLFGALPERL